MEDESEGGGTRAARNKDIRFFKEEKWESQKKTSEKAGKMRDLRAREGAETVLEKKKQEVDPSYEREAESSVRIGEKPRVARLGGAMFVKTKAEKFRGT